MKKIVSILLAILMLAAMFTGCAKKAEDTPESTHTRTVEDDEVDARDDTPKKDVRDLVSTFFDKGDAPKPAGTHTVAVSAVVIARDDIPANDIYKFVSAIFDNKDAITEQHAKGGELDLDFASSVTSVPYHPGAAMYFEDHGRKVSSVKEGAGQGVRGALTFGTGGDTGTYYAYGGILSSYVSSNTDLIVTAVTSGGSQANIEDLSAGNVQLAFVQSDVMSYGYNGERLFESPVAGFSVVAALYMEQVQIVTTDSQIQSVADLKGKTVSIGAAGSGVYFNALDILGSYGMTENDISAVYQSFGDSADSLKDGKIDAAFIVAGAPTPAIIDLSTAGPVYLVSLDDSHTERLLKLSPYYSAYTIPDGTYNNTAAPAAPKPNDAYTDAAGEARDDIPENDTSKPLSTIFGMKDDSKSLVGEWQATLEMVDLINESIAADPDMASYIKIDSFAMKMDLSLRNDGSFTMALNEASVIDAVNGIKIPMRDGINAYMEDMASGVGMSVDDLLDAVGMDLDSMIDEMLSPDMILSSIGDASESGNYVAQDGKLYLLNAGVTKPSANDEAIPYTLSGNKLSLEKPVGDDLGEFADFFPLEFTK